MWEYVLQTAQQQMEHLNRLCEDAVQGAGANKMDNFKSQKVHSNSVRCYGSVWQDNYHL